MKRLTLVAVLLVACAPETTPLDASSDAPDAATLDGADAGADAPDAGGEEETPDAGADTPDAGLPPDPGCTAGACEVMIASCQVQLGAEPMGRCLDRDPTLQVPPGFDDLYAERYCVPVCLEFRDGQMVQCFAQKGLQCLEGSAGREQAIEVCVPYAPPRDEACRTACWTTRTNCENACPLTSFVDCMDCELDCGIAWQHCINACPEAP